MHLFCRIWYAEIPRESGRAGVELAQHLLEITEWVNKVKILSVV
jgi:hypothetical protein